MTTAAQDLLIHRTEDTAGGGYEPSEPWYYLCGGEIPKLEEIKAANCLRDTVLTGHDRRETHPPRIRDILEDLFEEEQLRLSDRFTRWGQVNAEGIDAVSRHDIETTDHSNPGLALCSALALAYNQVAASRGKMKMIQEMIKEISK